MRWRRREGKHDGLTRVERRAFDELIDVYYRLDAIDLRRATGTQVVAVPAERPRRTGPQAIGPAPAGTGNRGGNRLLRWRRRR